MLKKLIRENRKFKRLASEFLKIVDFVFWTDYQFKLDNYAREFHNPIYQFKKNEITLIHLPKTGGTSLKNLLNQDESSNFTNLSKHRPVSQLCDPMEYSYITVMRDPVQRVWSHYQMVLRERPDYPYRRFANNGIECFLKHCWGARNMACRYYSGEVTQEPNPETLQKALNNLMNFTCVISFDNFEKEASEFLAKYNIQMSSIPHKRKSSYPLYNQNEYNLIQEYNKLDMELFAKWKEQSTLGAKPVLKNS